MGSGEETCGSLEIIRLAYLQLQKGDSQRATEYFEGAAESARDEGNVDVMISCYLNAGACLVSRGQLQRGKRLLLSSLKLVKTQKPDKNMSRTKEGKETLATMAEISADIYYNLAVAAKKMDNMKRAISHFKTSAELYLKSGCVQHAAESFTGTARCHRQVGEADEEVACLVSAQQLYRDAGDSFNEAESCLELARTHVRERRMEDCQEMLSTAKLLCLRVNQGGLQGKLYLCRSTTISLVLLFLKENSTHNLGSSIHQSDSTIWAYRTLKGLCHWFEKSLKQWNHCKPKLLCCRTLVQLTMRRDCLWKQQCFTKLLSLFMVSS